MYMYNMDKHPDGTNAKEKIIYIQCYLVKVHSRQLRVQGVEIVVVEYSEFDKLRIAWIIYIHGRGYAHHDRPQSTILCG